jgi:hypothetical protein
VALIGPALAAAPCYRLGRGGTTDRDRIAGGKGFDQRRVEFFVEVAQHLGVSFPACNVWFAGRHREPSSWLR